MKTVIVTGASKGIGLYIAKLLTTKGYNVIGIARTKPQDVSFEFVEADLTDVSIYNDLFDFLNGRKVYALINCAGVLTSGLLVKSKIFDISYMINLNFLSTILTTKYIYKHLEKDSSRIINFSSIAASLSLPGDSVYSATKTAVESFSKSISKEYSRRNVTVNCIAPSIILTNMTSSLPESIFTSLRSEQIIQKQTVLDDIDGVLYFLLSDESSFITGDVFHLGGV